MADIDTSMYGNIQVNNPTKTLGDMVGIANAVQQNRGLQMQNAQSGVDLQEMQASRPVLQDTDSYMDERGNIDFNKLLPKIMTVAPKSGAAILSSMAQSQQQHTAAQNAIMGQSADALSRVSNAIASIKPEDATPQSLAQVRDSINKNFTAPEAVAATNQLFDHAIQVAKSTSPNDPIRAKGLGQLAMMYQPIQTQQAINTPTVVGVDNAQQTYGVNIKPGVAGTPQGGIVQGTYAQKQLAPSTPVMQGNTPGYLGPQTEGSTVGGTPQHAGFQSAGLPVGAVDNLRDIQDTMKKHFESLQDASKDAPLVQSLRTNVRTLAKDAITGTESGRLSYVNGLLSAVGIPGTKDLKTSSDLLEKSLAMLNLTSPASTDAARTLVTAARPNSKMSEKAVIEATDQIAAQVEANMAIRNHLSRYKYANGGQGDAVSYQAERQNIEKLADPAAWRYIRLKAGSPEAKEFAKSLPKEERETLASKINTLEQMGMLK